MPDLQGRTGQRNFCKVPAQAAYTTGIHARSMSAHVILLDNYDLQPSQRAVKGGRTSVKAPSHHEDIWRHAAGTCMSGGRLAWAIAARGTGLRVGRIRKYPTSCMETPSSSAMMADTVSPHIRPWQGPMPHLRYDFTWLGPFPPICTADLTWPAVTSSQRHTMVSDRRGRALEGA